MGMKAVVMAGGEGTRLRPLTTNQPKPMVSVAGKPCIEHIVELVKSHGVEEVVATLAFLPQIIRGYLGNGGNLGVALDYSVEDVPAGTAGSVKQCESLLDETFIVISGDAVTDLDLTDLVKAHKASGALATLALKRVANPLDFGVVITAEDGRIERFLEKPGWSEVFSDTINTGIYVLEPEIFEHVPTDESYDFSRQLFPKLLDAGAPLFGHVMDGYWQDIGAISQYQETNRDALDGKVGLNIPGVCLRENIYLGEGAIIPDIENIQGPAVIGNYCTVDPDALIGRYTVLGNNVVVKEFAETQNCVIESNTYLGPRCQVRGAVVGKSCDVRAHAIVSEGAVIGDRCSIGAQSMIAANVRVYPFKQIDTGTQVTTSLIWEERGLSTLFGKEGVAGLVNIDITPEMATRLATAYGTTLSGGDRVVASRDAHPASRMIKRSMIAGLASTGVHVEDLRVSSGAINRFEVKNSAAQGGFHVRLSESDPECVRILFFERTGTLLTEAAEMEVEKYYNRQEYRRAPIDRLGGLLFPARVTESYVKALLDAVDSERIRERGFKVVMDYAYSSAAMVVPALLQALGVEHVSVHASLDPDVQDTRPMGAESLAESTQALASAMRADVGFVFGAAAERIALIDDKGKTIDPTTTLFLMLHLVAAHAGRGGKIVLPAHVSEVAEHIVGDNGHEVDRVSISSRSLMLAADRDEVIFAGSPDGAFAFPGLLPGYDAVLSLMKFLEYLALEKKPLSELCGQLPKTNLVHKRAAVPWSLKGLVMRAVTEHVRDENVDLTEGIRIRHDGGWTHVLPDSEEPYFHIYAEGKTATESVRLAERYRALIEEVISANT